MLTVQERKQERFSACVCVSAAELTSALSHVFSQLWSCFNSAYLHSVSARNRYCSSYKLDLVQVSVKVPV